MMQYALSNRQMKELAIRGAHLRIAIPCDVGCQSVEQDPLAFARDHLLHVDRRYFREAEVLEMVVHIKPSAKPDAVHTILGEFVTNADECFGIVQTVVVVVVDLWANENVRQQLPIQWPAKLIYPDRTEWPTNTTP